MATNLTLITNKKSSPTYASAVGGNPFRYEAPSGYEIIGFHGRSGILLDQLGVQVRWSTRRAAVAPSAQPLPSRAQEVVATLAGTPGDVGYRDGLGSVARFNRPYNMALDGAGTLYVTDFPNHVIRKIVPTGEVVTLAGTPGESGHRDGPGGTARFNGPRGIAIDAAGMLYVAEAGNHTIRKITPAGEVSTLAGTPGQSGNANGAGNAARFNTPDGMVIDTAGMLYVADANNHTIRKVTPTGEVSTIAGTAGQRGHADGAGSAARFARPVGVAVDTTGTLSIAENGNHTIRKVTSAGEVSTIAGAPGQSGHADGLGSAARFQEPNGIAVDATGTLYVTEMGNHTIRKITPAGEVTTLAGSPGQREARDGLGSSTRFNLPTGIVVNTTGTLYVADQGNAVIRTLRPNHTARIVSTLAGLAGLAGHADGAGSVARFNHPYNIALDAAGVLYLADEVNHVIRKITPTGEVTTLAGVPGQSGHRDGPGRDARFNRPRHLVVDTAGTVYVTDAGNHVLRRVTPLGQVTTLAGAAGLSGHRDGLASTARFNAPDGIAIDATGMLYVADYNNHVIRTVTPAGEVTTPVGIAGVSGHRDGLCTAALLSRPQGLALGRAGTLYIVEEGNQVVRQVTATGQVSTLAGVPGQSGHRDGPGSVARFQDPNSVAVDAAGTLYIAEPGTHTIRIITPTGEVATLAESAGERGSHDGPGGMARFHAPMGIAVNAAGIIYVADGDNHVLRQLTPRGVV